MVVKIAANHGDNGKNGKSLFIGREKVINEVIEDVKSNKGTRLLLVGESGIGKSALLDELHRRLTEEEDQRNKTFVGYYSKKESLIAESESLLYPFSIVSEKLVNSANSFLINPLHYVKLNSPDYILIIMTLSLNCKDAGDPVCTHTMYGETEEELIENARMHGIQVHGYTEEDWEKEIASNFEHFRKHIKNT